MKTTIIQQLLKDELKASVEGDTYSLAGEDTLTVFAQQGQSAMQVQGVKSIRFQEEFLSLFTEDDVYYLEPDVVLGLKATNPTIDKEEKRTGFRH